MVKGLTAWLPPHCVHRVQAGDTILIHAAAGGGVGRLLCAWANHLGATVIGTVGSAEKAEVARRSGCRHTILYREEDFVARVKTLTDGKGLTVAYDLVGRDTIPGSLACLAPLGHLVSFGQSSGAARPIAMAELASRSITVTRPVVSPHIDNRTTLEQAASSLFAAIGAGILEPVIAARFSLSEAGAAHRMLEARQSTGSLVLLP